MKTLSVRNRILSGTLLAGVLSCMATVAMAAKPGGGGDSCSGATPSFVFGKVNTPLPRKDIYLSNATGTCTRLLFSVSSGNYNRAMSFRVIEPTPGTIEGRVVLSDGGSTLLLARFPIGADMVVSNVVTANIFKPSQPGFIDNGYFDLASDGRSLVYITSDETAVDDEPLPSGSSVYRLRSIPNVDDCVQTADREACDYDDGTLLAERVGLYYRIALPRWSADTDRASVYLLDYYGDGYNPYISRVPSGPPQVGAPLHEPQPVIDEPQLSLFELRRRGDQEMLVYSARSDRTTSSCNELRVVDTASCESLSCARINSVASRVVVGPRASVQSATATSLTILVDGATVSRRGSCSYTSMVTRISDSPEGVQSTAIGSGFGPAAR